MIDSGSPSICHHKLLNVLFMDQLSGHEELHFAGILTLLFMKGLDGQVLGIKGHQNVSIVLHLHILNWNLKWVRDKSVVL